MCTYSILTEGISSCIQFSSPESEGKTLKRTTGATQSKQNSTLLSHSDLHNAKP